MLQWFRRKPREGTEAPKEAAPPPRTVIEPEVTAGAEAPEESGQKRPRRRGSRGGRGRKKPTETAGSTEAEAKPAEKKPARARSGERKQGERRPGDRKRADDQKRRRAPRRNVTGGTRAALADVKKEILVSVEVGEQRVAVLEDGKPSEVYLERPGRRSIAGNVYKGVVDNVLPGMEASFVDIGLDRNGFLYVDEIVVPELEGKRHGRRIQELIQRGQEVLVQAVKDPMGTKGARLTTEISLPGRFLVYTPFGEGVGISRRLEDDERERLKAISKELELPEGGIIIRTAAEGASKEELAGDLALLRKLWATIQGRASRAKAPTLVYQEAELPLRIVRDLFIRDFERVVVDHDRTYRRLVGYLKRTSTDLASRVELYKGREPLMEAAGVEAAVRSTLDRRVDLPSGGYLIFDYAEAFTVIDVNTGRFVGARGKQSGARLEDTITKNNLEAVEEVVRQLRLRDIGGIIVIDFIDMANPKNRQSVEDALKRELDKDRTKTYVVEISPLGLVEMTRQNVTDGPREILTQKCEICQGDGIVVSDETRAVDFERELRRLVRASRHQAFKLELRTSVADVLVGPGAVRLAELEGETGRRFFLETRDDVASDHFVVVDKGPVSRLEPKSLPVKEGEELNVRLEEVLPDAALARLNGYAIAVAGARAKVGQKKVKVRIERATKSIAYAVLAEADRTEPPVEAGAELEQDRDALEQKPRSRSRRGGSGRAKLAVTTDPAEPVEVAEPAEAAVEAEPVAVEAGDEEPEKPKKKKKTRRGSRGGRGRKKKAAAPATTDGAAAGEPPLEAAGEPSPDRDRGAEVDVAAPAEVVAVEGEDAGPEKSKKKTRRGSRGGRNRKRKRPATVEDGAPESESQGPATPVAAPEDPG